MGEYVLSTKPTFLFIHSFMSALLGIRGILYKWTIQNREISQCSLFISPPVLASVQLVTPTFRLRIFSPLVIRLMLLSHCSIAASEDAHDTI